MLPYRITAFEHAWSHEWVILQGCELNFLVHQRNCPFWQLGNHHGMMGNNSGYLAVAIVTKSESYEWHGSVEVAVCKVQLHLVRAASMHCICGSMLHGSARLPRPQLKSTSSAPACCCSLPRGWLLPALQHCSRYDFQFPSCTETVTGVTPEVIKTCRTVVAISAFQICN